MSMREDETYRNMVGRHTPTFTLCGVPCGGCPVARAGRVYANAGIG